MRSFLLMLTFLTRIPVPVEIEFKEETFHRGVYFFPIIGVTIGMVLVGLRFLTKDIPISISAIIVILGYVFITGGLHLDGLADFSDGYFSGRSKSRILEIMSDSHIGTFGVLSLIIYFVVTVPQVGMLSYQTLFLLPLVGRCMGLVACSMSRPAKDDGLGASLIRYSGPWIGIYAMLVLVVGTVTLTPLHIFSLMGTVTIMIIFLVRVNKVLGGITGDVIGATIELSQCVWLLTTLISEVKW